MTIQQPHPDPLILLGPLGNGFVIHFVAVKKRMHQPMYFIVSLASADFCVVGFFTLPLCAH